MRGRSPPRPLLAVPNVTARPSTVSVPIAALLYYCPLLCGFTVSLNCCLPAAGDCRRFFLLNSVLCPGNVFDVVVSP